MCGDGAKVVISQEAPTPWITAPKLETRLAIQISKKIRYRKGDRVAARQLVGFPTAAFERGVTARP
jgi:hypothetical protein